MRSGNAGVGHVKIPHTGRPAVDFELTRLLFGRASRSHSIDHLSPELRRISGSVAGHRASDTSKINFNGVHQTGSTPTPVGEVSTQNLISLRVYGQKGEAPPEFLLQTIASERGEPIDRAISKVNAVAAGVHRQFTNLAANPAVRKRET